MSKGKVEIRRAREDDLPEILAIEDVSFPSPWGGPMYFHELIDPTAIFLAAFAGDEVAGYVSSRAILDEGHILKIAVKPEFRRRGIAEALMRELCRMMEPMGVTAIWLEVRKSNEAGRRFYNKIGFVAVGVRKKYYSDTNEDAVVLMKEFA